jgi:hypothetical protein
MKNLKGDPKKLLLANLKLVKGIEFSNPMGEILVSMAFGMEPAVIFDWQYRLMLRLDGSTQFIEAVRDVKSQFEGEFVAADIWTFLDWMIENELVEEHKDAVVGSRKGFSLPLVDVIAPQASRSWFKMPLQIIGVSLLCLASLGGAYFATPVVVTLFKSLPVASSPKMAVESSAPIAATENKASRLPEIAETKEVTFAARAPQGFEALPTLPGDEATGTSLIEKLLGMRQELAACQIRRDEYYLLNDENGYSQEVAKITELVKEIGEIRTQIIN